MSDSYGFQVKVREISHTAEAPCPIWYIITTVIQITMNNHNVITDPHKYYIQIYKFYTVTQHIPTVHIIHRSVL